MFNLPVAIGVISGLLFLIMASLANKLYDSATPLQKLKNNVIAAIVAGVILGLAIAVLSKIL